MLQSHDQSVPTGRHTETAVVATAWADANTDPTSCACLCECAADVILHKLHKKREHRWADLRCDAWQQEKSDVEAAAATPALAEARETVIALTRQAGKVQQDCGLDILPDEFARSVLKWGLMEVHLRIFAALC